MSRKESLAKAAVIALAVLVIYFPAMRGQFVWDDEPLLTDNSMIQGSRGLYRLWFTTEPLDYFPMMSTSLWVEWRLWGANPAGYHVTNVLLHVLGAILLWRVLERLRVPAAWLAALVFAVHPVNAQSVAWIAERKNTLSMVFYAASLLAFLKFDQGSGRRWYGFALGFFLLALLSKTSVVMLPVVLLGCAWWQRGKVSLRDALRAAPFFLLSAALGAITVWFQYKRSMGGAPLEMPALYPRLAAAGCAVWFYLGKVVAPLGLCAIYPGWHPGAIADLPIWPALLLAASFVLFWLYRKSWGRPFLFGVVYYVVMLLPVLGLLRMSVMQLSLVMDYFQYPALIGPIALILGLSAYGVERSKGRLGKFAPVAAAALVGILGLHTWQQAHIYESAETLWRSTLKCNPESWTAHNNMSVVYFQQGKLEDALREAAEALRLKPDHAPANYNMGKTLLRMGRKEEAVAHLRRAVAIWPQYEPAQRDLADALSETGKPEEAIHHYREALRIKPEDVQTRYNLANLFAQQGRMEEAAACYREILQASPEFAAAHNNLARALAGQGKIEEAIAHYRAALKRMPDSARILANLAWLLACTEDARFRDGAEALRLAERASELSGGKDVKVLDTLAAACAGVGRFDDAARWARKALELASSAGQKTKAEQIRRRVELYESRKPLRLGPGIPSE